MHKQFSILGLLVLICGLLTPAAALAQRIPPKKDSLQMSCLLFDASMTLGDQKQEEMFETKELKLVLSSPTDTTVKACADGVVSTVQRDADGKYEIVFYHNDYWFWLSGVGKPAVRPKQKIKSGQPLGIIQPGDKIELLLFDFETPVDPRNYLKCDQ